MAQAWSPDAATDHYQQSVGVLVPMELMVSVPQLSLAWPPWGTALTVKQDEIVQPALAATVIL
jgi:hypothetical protein